MKRKMPIPYLYCILAGLILGLFLGTRFYWYYMLWGDTDKFEWERYFASPFVNQVWWGILAPLVFYCYNRFDINKNRFWAIMISIFVALFHEVTSYFVWLIPSYLLGFEEIELEKIPKMFRGVPTGFIAQWIQYWIIWGVFFALDYAKRYKDKEVELARMENQLSNAQLDALRLQLQPHFLFNTLNTISSLMEFNKKDAQKTVTRLGNLLRTVLDKNRTNEISLSEELAFTQSYLDIEQMRFHDRLVINYNLDESLNQIKVPCLILQPLVENAIKHGISTLSEGGIIEVKTSKKEDGKIELVVKDNGKGTNESFQSLLGKGIGLRNVKDRLDLIYGENYGMRLRSRIGEGFEIFMILPQ